MAVEDVRSFVAVELPDEIKASLSELQHRMKAGGARAQWVAPQSIHLTLKFLGDISVSSVPDVVALMEEAALGTGRLRLGVRGLGVFPDDRRVRVVWAGVTGDLDRLGALKKRLDEGLEVLGFAAESRPFAAHLTIARLREEASPAERQTIVRFVSGSSFEGADFPVDAISLMKSQLTREGAIYSRLASAALSPQ